MPRQAPPSSSLIEPLGTGPGLRCIGGLSCDVVETEASVGGGAFPTARIPSFAVALSGQADEIERRLRVGTHAVIGRIGNGRLMLDLRSVPEAYDDQLVRAVTASLSTPA